MPLTPEDVANKQFTSTRLRPGYDEAQVDDFLDEVEGELTRLYRENEDLRFRVETLQRELEQARSKGGLGGGGGMGGSGMSRLPEPVQQAAPPVRREPQPSTEMEPVGDRASGILAMAQRTADQFVTEARAESDRLLAQARSRAADIARDAEELRRTRVGALDTERSDLQRKIEELRIFEREYRNRLRAYLENQLREITSGETNDRGGNNENGGGRGYAQTGPAFATFGGGRQGLPGRTEPND